jgi:hypothetical protein
MGSLRAGGGMARQTSGNGLQQLSSSLAQIPVYSFETPTGAEITAAEAAMTQNHLGFLDGQIHAR